MVKASPTSSMVTAISDTPIPLECHSKDEEKAKDNEEPKECKQKESEEANRGLRFFPHPTHFRELTKVWKTKI